MKQDVRSVPFFESKPVDKPEIQRFRREEKEGAVRVSPGKAELLPPPALIFDASFRRKMLSEKTISPCKL